MKTLTEKKGLKKLSNESKKKVKLILNEGTLERSQITTLMNYFGTKSEKNVFFYSCLFLTGKLIEANKDILEQTNYDKVKWLNQDNKYLKSDAKQVSVPIWQILIIVSNTNESIDSHQKFVKYVLSETYRIVTVLFEGNS